MCEVDVFAENFTLIDWELHDLWIRGLSVTEAVTVTRERGAISPAAEYPGITQDMLVSDVNDHYRLFSMLEHLLLTVGNFSEQLLYQMTPDTRTRLVEKYYSLDGALCRELLGKKLSSRVRRDLDEVSDKCGVSLKSCRRQFDNVKRVFKAIEDMPGGYVANIEKHFGISRDLAEQYATIVFIASFRFEMGKRKLAPLTFAQIRRVCLVLMGAWLVDCEAPSSSSATGGGATSSGGVAASGVGVAAVDTEPGLDKEFLGSLKELKVLLDRDKEHRNVACSILQSRPDSMSPKSYSEVEANFKMLTRNILSLGQSLSSNKEVRDFFVHLVEKLADPLRSMGLDSGEAAAFLEAYSDAVSSGDALLGVDDSVKRTLAKFMATLTPCILAVY